MAIFKNQEGFRPRCKNMFKVRFFSSRRPRHSSDAREQRHKQFILLAVAFGFLLYTMNVSGRI